MLNSISQSIPMPTHRYLGRKDTISQFMWNKLVPEFPTSPLGIATNEIIASHTLNQRISAFNGDNTF